VCEGVGREQSEAGGRIEDESEYLREYVEILTRSQEGAVKSLGGDLRHARKEGVEVGDCEVLVSSDWARKGKPMT